MILRFEQDLNWNEKFASFFWFIMNVDASLCVFAANDMNAWRLNRIDEADNDETSV